LVHHASYAYFYKKEKEYFYQPFDRITHQHGAFLAPKPVPQSDKRSTIEREIFKKEIQETYLEKIILAGNLKQELFHKFGGREGLNYYFPKIPQLVCSQKTDIRKTYEDLEGVTFLKCRKAKESCALSKVFSRLKNNQ
jgi:hypothetical protein